jgi:pimeloyl-ACP methyl ester carboxylesterase
MGDTGFTGAADVNGARLYFEVAGEGPAIVLLHAGIADSRMWDAQVGAFAEAFRVLRYDTRGYGRSNFPPGPFARHEDLHGLLRHFGIERAALVGCSMGGATAIDFALQHPEMVTALVPVASGLGGYQWSDVVSAYDEEEEAALERGDIDAVIELNLRFWVDGPRRTPEQVSPAVREAARAMLRDSSTSTEGQPQPLEPPAITRVAEIDTPTLVVVGDEDVADIGVIADLLVTGIRGARKAVITGAAHLPNMERPAEFNRSVLDFLRGLPV